MEIQDSHRLFSAADSHSLALRPGQRKRTHRFYFIIAMVDVLCKRFFASRYARLTWASQLRQQRAYRKEDTPKMTHRGPSAESSNPARLGFHMEQNRCLSCFCAKCLSHAASINGPRISMGSPSLPYRAPEESDALGGSTNGARSWPANRQCSRTTHPAAPCYPGPIR